MNKRKLHHYFRVIRSVPFWAFLVAAVFFLIVAAFALRANNQKMLELRQAVFTADEQNGDVEAALRQLREHVHAHMNTDLAAGDNAIRPPIQLKHRYERLLAEAIAASQNSNAQIYTDAQNYCEQQISSGFSGSGRVACIQQYVDTHGAPEAAKVSIPEDAYKFDFASPAWSPDLAGWSLVLAGLSFFLFAVSLGGQLIIRQQLRQ